LIFKLFLLSCNNWVSKSRSTARRTQVAVPKEFKLSTLPVAPRDWPVEVELLYSNNQLPRRALVLVSYKLSDARRSLMDVSLMIPRKFLEMITGAKHKLVKQPDIQWFKAPISAKPISKSLSLSKLAKVHCYVSCSFNKTKFSKANFASVPVQPT